MDFISGGASVITTISAGFKQQCPSAAMRTSMSLSSFRQWRSNPYFRACSVRSSKNAPVIQPVPRRCPYPMFRKCFNWNSAATKKLPVWIDVLPTDTAEIFPWPARSCWMPLIIASSCLKMMSASMKQINSGCDAGGFAARNASAAFTPSVLHFASGTFTAWYIV
ncbi:unnamed protein product [Prorocentrum cordatum]|uniref:Uncharacterized protein n=1 Tax=Prorocentrum cordatum TaxID=2364126 RepID=A0ABN9UQS6_9DINO|nr:unnamed protein product [Polarella glacialis]